MIVGVVLLSLGSLLHFLVRLSALRAAEHYERFCGQPPARAGQPPAEPEGGLGLAHLRSRAAACLLRLSPGAVASSPGRSSCCLPSFTSLILGSIILALVLHAATTLLLALLAAAVFLAQYPAQQPVGPGQLALGAAAARRDAHGGAAAGPQRTAAVPLGEDSAVLDRLFAKRGEVRRDISLYGDPASVAARGRCSSPGSAATYCSVPRCLLIAGDVLAGERSWAQVAGLCRGPAADVLKDFASASKFMSGLSLPVLPGRALYPLRPLGCAGRCGVGEITGLGTSLFFTATDGSDRELWRLAG